ncbi:terminase [Mycolicibacterium setense]
MSEAESLVPGARHAIAPVGIATTAWPRIKATCRNIGWRFDPWQDAIGRLILAKKAGGGWAADLSLLSIPRQVGKSYLLGCIIFALCLLTPKLRVIWTSHHTATTEEMFDSMKELASHRRVKPHVLSCVALQGSRWRIKFRNGSRIDFGARSQGFGRGKAKVGVLVLDEFQHITSRALANLAPTTNTADNPLILCAGTPPGPEVSGEAFTMRRTAALDGIANDCVYVEFSADSNADSDDRRQWSKANPSFPKRTPERALLLLRKVLDEADFRREALGIWDEKAKHQAAIKPAIWKQLFNVAVDGVRPDCLGVDMSHAGEISVSACWVDGDNAHAEEVWAGPSAASAIEWIDARTTRRTPIVIDGASPAAAMIPELKQRRKHVITSTAWDMARACGQVVNKALAAQLTHGGQDSVTDALMGAKKRPIRDAGGWGWDRSDETVNIAPLVAFTLAVFGASITRRKPSNSTRQREAVLL